MTLTQMNTNPFEMAWSGLESAANVALRVSGRFVWTATVVGASVALLTMTTLNSSFREIFRPSKLNE